MPAPKRRVGLLPLLVASLFLILGVLAWLQHRWLGPMLREWYRHRSLPYRTKLLAIVTMLISFGASIVLVVQPAWGKVLLGALAVGLAVGLYRIPSRDGPGAKPGPTAN